jgi:hypothetical protein
VSPDDRPTEPAWEDDGTPRANSVHDRNIIETSDNRETAEVDRARDDTEIHAIAERRRAWRQVRQQINAWLIRGTIALIGYIVTTGHAPVVLEELGHWLGVWLHNHTPPL